MKLAVVGSRSVNKAQFKKIIETLEELDTDGLKIVTGDASGVDEAARFWAHTNCSTGALVFYAKWKELGKGAGFVRNQFIVDEADEMIAFICQHESRGTKNSIEKARKKGIKVTEINLTNLL